MEIPFMKRSLITIRILLMGVVILLSLHSAFAVSQEKLRVAVTDRSPYSFRDEEGKWSGLGVALWEQIAGRLGIGFEYVEVPFDQITSTLSSGACDLTPVLAVSADKSSLVRFSNPYLISHGALLTRRECVAREMLNLTKQLVNRQMLVILAVMLLTMVVFSAALLAIERRQREGHFTGSAWKGFGTALWFSAVTMTTVGYGDKTPVSPLSRLLTFVWMMFGVLVLAVFTGSVSSSLTMADITSGIIRLNELNKFDVGVLKGSRMDELIESRGIPAVRYGTLKEGLDALQSRESISAFAGDDISLGYAISRGYAGQFHLSLIPAAELNHSFAFRPGLPNMELINADLMQITLAPDWRTRCEKWTGPSVF